MNNHDTMLTFEQVVKFCKIIHILSGVFTMMFTATLLLLMCHQALCTADASEHPTDISIIDVSF